MTEFESKVLGELAVLKSQMEQLMGIGQPGRLNALEMRVGEHEQAMQLLKGVGAAFGALLTVVHLGIAWVVKK
jgi:hypothetical protein